MNGNGDLFVTEEENNTIRKVTTAGVTTTVAGAPPVAGSSDGTGSAATFNAADSAVADAGGNLYVPFEHA